MIEINANTRIDEQELNFTASRSAGPGGQNVNKVNTRITLLFHVDNSPSLCESKKHRIAGRLRTRIDSRGYLRVVCQKHRTQQANRNAAVERFRELIADALHVRPARHKTKVPRRAIEKRLGDKKKRAMLKKQRMQSGRGDDWEP